MTASIARIVFFGVLIAIALPSLAEVPQKAPPFMREVFPPELVMQSARAIALRPEQRKAITQAIQQTQAKTLELEWDMQDAAGDLAHQISQTRVDSKAALAAMERVLSIEGQVKRAHMGLLIEIKNQLDAEQQKKLKAIRDQQSP